MVIKQTPPRTDGLHHHQQQRDQKQRTRKLAVVAVAAAIVILAIALLLPDRRGSDGSRPADTFNPPAPVGPAQAQAEALAERFSSDFASFDADKAMSYVADGADLSHLIDGQVPDDVRGMSLMVGLLDAFGYRQSIRSCQAAQPTDFGAVSVTCRIDFHAIRSAEVGNGPYAGHLSFLVEDGLIQQASIDWNLTRFSPETWEPFRDWVRATHPKDLDVMYIDDGGNFRLTDESIRLWRERTKEYVRYVNGAP